MVGCDERTSSIRMPPVWRRFGLHGGAAALLVVGLVCARSSSGPGPPVSDFERYHDQAFRLARVIDGDTLDLEVPDGGKLTTWVRLWGVDAPEMRGDGGPSHFAAEATAFARQMLEGREVHVVLWDERTRGYYGRLLAYVFLERGGRMFNEILVEGGYAYADPRFAHPYMDRFLRLERQARKVGAGLWAEVKAEEMPAWRRE